MDRWKIDGCTSERMNGWMARRKLGKYGNGRRKKMEMVNGERNVKIIKQ